MCSFRSFVFVLNVLVAKKRICSEIHRKNYCNSIGYFAKLKFVLKWSCVETWVELIFRIQEYFHFFFARRKKTSNFFDILYVLVMRMLLFVYKRRGWSHEMCSPHKDKRVYTRRNLYQVHFSVLQIEIKWWKNNWVHRWENRMGQCRRDQKKSIYDCAQGYKQNTYAYAWMM